MINVHWCNNVIRDYSSIREVSHLKYRYRIDLRFSISCMLCHSSSSSDGTKGIIDSQISGGRWVLGVMLPQTVVDSNESEISWFGVPLVCLFDNFRFGPACTTFFQFLPNVHMSDMMSEERADDLAAAASSTTTRTQRYSGGQLTLSGSGRDNAGDCKQKEQEAHTDDAKDPDVTNTTHIDDVEEVNPAATAQTADYAEDIAGTVQDLSDNTVDQQQVTDEEVIYLHKADAENKLRDKKKQPFMLYSQKECLKISLERSYKKEKHYKVKTRLGRGACGECFLAFDLVTGFQFVTKSICGWQKDKDWKTAFKETRILCRLDKLYGCIPSEEEFLIFMEYIPGKTLADYLESCERMSLKVTLIIGRQLLQHLAHMEEKNVTHGDITFDNIMVSTNWCTHVIDYGNGCVLDDDNSDKYEDLYAVLHRIIYMIALSYPWKQYYTGLELFDHVEKGELYMFAGTPQLHKFIKDCLCLCDSAELLDRVDTEFINDIVAVDPAVFGEHVVPPCGGTPLHDNKDDKYIGIPIQESFKAHAEEE
ncbi:hypothetical protein LSAT2_023561 [Lamellibrachia satsuma]|nr:hypothetical protein LSAT2_023561 [Lamellibrachia satsuma]